MAVKQTDPLSWTTRIVDSNGLPTAEFARKWAQQQAANNKITDLSTQAAVSAVLDKIGAKRGDILYRDAAGWRVLVPGAAGTLLASGGVGANPLWETISTALDSLGAAQGDMLYRGSSGWLALAPGTTGQVLTTAGAGANPAWGPSLAYAQPGLDKLIDRFPVDLFRDGVAVGAGGGGGIVLPIANTPTQATFTTTLGAPVSKTDVAGVGVLFDGGAWANSDRLSGYGVSLPATPYTLDIGLRYFGLPGGFSFAGIYVSDGTKVVTFSRHAQNSTGGTAPSLGVAHWNSVTSFNAEPYIKYSDYPEILRMIDDGTNLSFYASREGYAFTPIYSESRTAFLTPSSIGFVASASDGGNSHPAGDIQALLTYWRVH